MSNRPSWTNLVLACAVFGLAGYLIGMSKMTTKTAIDGVVEIPDARDQPVPEPRELVVPEPRQIPDGVDRPDPTIPAPARRPK